MASDDWQVGDLALCVNDDPCEFYPGSEGGVRKNGIYQVVSVRSLPDVYGRFHIGLRLDRHNPVHPVSGKEGSHHASRFRKIRPHAPDAEDAETIRLMRSKPAQVST